jgi:O-antigen/teichoic acid export membrane protein
MPEKVTESVNWLLVCLASFGMLAGIAKFLHEVSEERRRFTWLGLGSYAVISGFIGLLFGLIPLHYGLDIYAALFVSGSAGGIGWASLSILQWFVKAKLRQKLKSDEAESEETSDANS